MPLRSKSTAWPRALSKRCPRGRILKILIVGLTALGFAGCVTMNTIGSKVSDSPKEPWKPLTTPVKQTAAPPAPQIPPELQAIKRSLTLAHLVDIGLTNNAQTRAAWNSARAAAAALGTAESVFFPKAEVTANVARSKAAFAGGRFIVDQTTLNPIATLSFALLDFGTKKANVEAARQALEAANWTQNGVIQNVILQIEKAYYQYLAAKALFKAQEASLKGAQANSDAAGERHRAGVATMADVLQARTALSSAELEFVTTQGLIQTLHGLLANALGLPANADFDVADDLTETIPLQEISEEVDACIKDAEARRPDLSASRSYVLSAEAQVRQAQANRLPVLTMSASIGKIYYQGRAISNDTFGIAALLDIPIFSGFLRDYQLAEAQAEAEAARAQMAKLEQDVTFQVWTSYYGLKTAEQQINTSKDLLESAQQSYDVALGRYKEGVGSILDLLAAQSALENGRAQSIQARTEWFLALVQFAHDTGTLSVPGPATNPGQQSGAKKGEQ
jgi:outer membrane protein